MPESAEHDFGAFGVSVSVERNAYPVAPVARMSYRRRCVSGAVLRAG